MPITKDKFIQIIEDPMAPFTGISVGFDRAIVLGYALEYMSGDPTKVAVGKINGYLNSIESGAARPKSSTNFEGGQGPLVDLLKAKIKLYYSKAAAKEEAVVLAAQKELNTYEITRDGKTGSLAQSRDGNPSGLPTIPSGAFKGKAGADQKPDKVVTFKGVKQVRFMGLEGNKGDDPRSS